MAGDVSYLNIMNNNNLIKQLYIGKMRYWISQFSLEKYKYHDDSQNKNIGKYEHLRRKANGRATYSVLNFTTINEIRDILNDVPINNEEKNAYEDMKNFIDFINENLDLIINNNYDIVFYTAHDF